MGQVRRCKLLLMMVAHQAFLSGGGSQVNMYGCVGVYVGVQA